MTEGEGFRVSKTNTKPLYYIVEVNRKFSLAFHVHTIVYMIKNISIKLRKARVNSG